MPSLHRITFLVAFLALISCTSTRTLRYPAAGRQHLCAKGGNGLGVVAVLPETAWRPEQKEAIARQEMAQRAISRVFADLSCGTLESPGGVRRFDKWSQSEENRLLEDFLLQGVDTVILVRIEELTPQIAITFSLPFLWSGFSESDVRLRVLATSGGPVILDQRVNRVTGGPFQLRPAAWAEKELEEGLRSIFVEK